MMCGLLQDDKARHVSKLCVCVFACWLRVVFFGTGFRKVSESKGSSLYVPSITQPCCARFWHRVHLQFNWRVIMCFCMLRANMQGLWPVCKPKGLPVGTAAISDSRVAEPCIYARSQQAGKRQYDHCLALNKQHATGAIGLRKTMCGSFGTGHAGLQRKDCTTRRNGAYTRPLASLQGQTFSSWHQTDCG